MKKQPIPYLIIIVVNLAILTVLLALWTDKLELTFNELVRPVEFLKICGITAVSFLGVQLFLLYARKKHLYAINFKTGGAIVITLITSSYLYSIYIPKVIQHIAINGAIRKNIAEKIKPAIGLANGTTASNLSIDEYRELMSITRFPALPNEAKNIAYSYRYDGFLPDYSFTLKYELPSKLKIDSFSFVKGNFSIEQSFKRLGNKIQVMYMEERY